VLRGEAAGMDAGIPDDGGGWVCAGTVTADAVVWAITGTAGEGLFVLRAKKAQPMTATRTRLTMLIEVKRKTGKWVNLFRPLPEYFYARSAF